ncbi:MAG: hypothetical protein O3A51_09505, partial [Verrucomicrobia bacterium]|nr:hypothetical protein [Verrucomicrobiota bacterium]
DADRPVIADLFDDSEKQRNCRYCKNYVVNPFTQWCSRHRKDVEATDVCEQFDRKPDEADPNAMSPKT